MVEDEDIQILMGLGLTLLQARIYLALCKTGTATVKTIYNSSNIARQDIYRIMPVLQELGLAEKLLSTPTKYRPTPIKDGYYLLLQKKASEYSELQNKTIALIKSLNKGYNKTMRQNEESQFVVTTSKNLLRKRLEEGAAKAQTRVDIIARRESFRIELFNILTWFKKAVKRSVKIRVITEKRSDDKTIEKLIQPIKWNSLFEIRYYPLPTPVEITIIDGKEVQLSLESTAVTGLPSLWTNNSQVVKIMTTYFEELWKNST
jgi:sugar-specific transcriptional regulator TrmB